jgi:uncharacterized protein YjbI with pentapeptide repeats
MNKTELIKRWQTKEGNELLQKVIHYLNNGKSLYNIEGLEKQNDRFDLRGAKLSVIKKENNIEVSGHSLSLKTGSLKLNNIVLESVDFSFADISYSYLKKCQFMNCIFENTKAKELKIYATDFKDCIFEKTDFSYSFMNENIASVSGSFINCKFLKTNLKECIFRFPKIENCLFEDCNTNATDFNGSRIKNSKFKGIVEDCWFRGYPQRVTTSILFLFNRINVKDYFNPMLNVDFSDSKLIDVSFSNEIDLSNCKFPNDDENYIYVKDLNKTYTKVKNEISISGNDEEKRILLSLIDLIYLTKDKQNQKSDFIDKFGFSKIKNSSIDNEKFFNLVRKFNS